MRRLLVQILCITEVLLCAADSPPLSEDTLKKLSAAGEQCVDEEMKRALLGVKQVKETMEKKEERHRHLMEALRHSGDKKKGAMQLIRETEQKLEEAEQQCQYLTKSSFEECQPCLEDTCKAFYTATCRRGFASFSFKVEDFFRRMAAQLEAEEHVYNQNQENVGHTNSPENQLPEASVDLEVLRADASFGRLLSNTSLLYDRSTALVKRMQQVFGHSFLAAFTTEVRPSSLSSMQGSSGSFFGSLGLDHVLESVSDFGRNVLEELSSTMADVFEEIQEAETYFQQPSTGTGALSAGGQPQSRHLCRRLRRQASECWQLQSLCETCDEYLLKECPSVQQLHSETEEMHMLLNASRQQYHDRLQLVQRHTADTQRWLRDMEDKYGWVGRLSNGTVGPHGTFSVIAVNAQQQQLKTTRPKADSSVVVTVLDSGPVTVSVPSELEVDDPAFIQYVAQEALTLHKQQIRGIDPCSAGA
ncbi:clusterin-like protein 1 [Cebidichthys violaceus]|uniref:clusterin-like protein 1 n=1 Tax=Cebidichthys violaceus TaxID=271503 RepID=UPI0035C9FDEA